MIFKCTGLIADRKCNFKINFCNFLVERKLKTKFSKTLLKSVMCNSLAIYRCQTVLRQVLNSKGWYSNKFTIAQFMLRESVPMRMALTMIYCCR